MSRAFFEEVTDVLVGVLPDELAGFESRRSSRNVKVWYDEPREHYEAQLLRVESAEGVRDGLEIGLHLEHSTAARNDAAMERLTPGRAGWRRSLGRSPTAGPFLGGRPEHWRRISEVWDPPEPDDADAPIEVADRLAAYVFALEPFRTSTGP